MDVKTILREKREKNNLDGCLINGCAEMFRATGDPQYRDAALEAMNAAVSSEGTLAATGLPEIGFYGKALLFALDETGEERYKTAAGIIRDALRVSDVTNPRGLYATRPFITAYDTRFGDKQSYKTIARQFELAVHSREAGQPFYLRPVSRPGEKALCPLEQAGYMLMALADTAEKMDMQIYEHYRMLIDLFLELVKELLPYRKTVLFSADLIHPDGQPNIAGNAMFAYSLLKGVRLGLLDEEKYLPIAMQMANGLKACGCEPQSLSFWLMMEAEIREVEKQ